MKRLLLVLTACIAGSVAACGDGNQGVKILVFQASPDSIEAGQSTTLVFGVDPPDAKVEITGIGDLTGQTKTSVAPTATTSYQITVSNGHATANKSVTVTVGPTSAVALKVDPVTATPGAGDAFDVVLTVLAGNGKPAPGFRGTVHVTSTDAKATLPPDVTFTAGDMGVKHVSVTLQTAGVAALTATDTTNKVGLQGSASVTVQPGAAKTFALSALPPTAVAGSSLELSITVKDAFGNIVTGFAGKAHLASTDATDILPPDGGFTSGVRVVQVAFIKTGDHIAQVQDVATVIASANTSSVAVTPGAPKLVLGLAASANAGYAQNVDVAVRDVFDNPIPNYAGTVTFTSTDNGAGAATPAPITFNGTQGGTATTTVTFMTPGLQTLSASDAGAPKASGAAAAAVHGLTYAGPTSGRVRLVANAAASNAQIVQLDLVASEKLEVSTFFGGGPGSFAAGMNLPLDTTRVAADTTLFTPGTALPAGPGTRAAIGRIGPDHVLYTAVSRKRIAGTVFNQETEVPAGGVFYSVRLKLTQSGSVGPVFDGSQPLAMFRAAVRDQWGDDFVNQAEIGIGKLEVR
jgi:hypothetical protein